MIEIKICATSANLGPGFDTLGVALSLYNYFKVEISDELIFENCEDKYSNENNLFYIGYKNVCDILNVNDKCHVIFDCHVPISRGLGSSASLICAGAIAANYLHGNILSKDEIFRICTNIEGHPDNIAPCIYGGLTASFESKKIMAIPLSIHPDIHFTAIIPDYEVSTKDAREALPKSIPMHDAIYNISHVIAMTNALQNNDKELLRAACLDKLHQPYRKALIKDYDLYEKICFDNQATAFMISGAGPTCLALSNFSNFSTAIIDSLDPSLKVIDLSVDFNGHVIKEL